MPLLRTIHRFLAVILLMTAATACMAAVNMDAAADNDTDSKVVAYSRQEIRRAYRKAMPPGIKYTRQHPLIIGADWSFPPFSYVNDEGQPAGLLIDIYREVFQRFHIAYEVHMMDRSEAQQQLMQGKVQLITDIDNLPSMRNVYRGQSVVSTYNVAVLCRRSTAMMHSVMLLGQSDTVMVNRESYAYYYLHDCFNDSLPFLLESVTPNVAVNRLLDGTAKYFIWDEAALRSLVTKYNIADVMQIERADVPQGQMRFFSNDTILLNRIDLVMQQLQETNQYQPVYERWMTGTVPQSRNLSTHVVLFAILVIAVVILIFVVLRSSIPSRLKTEFKSIAGIAVDMANCQVIAISVSRLWVYNFAGDFMPKEGIDFSEFLALIHPDDVKTIHQVKKTVDSGAREMPDVRFRMRHYNDPDRQYHNMLAKASIKMRHGHPVYVFLTLQDETGHLHEKKQLDHMLLEFESIPNMSDIGLAYYNAAGKIINRNAAYMRIFSKGKTDRVAAFLDNTRLGELCIMLNGLVLEQDMDTWICAPVDIPQLNLRGTAEVRVRTVWDTRHHSLGYVVSISDLQDTISLHRELAKVDHELSDIKKLLQRYQAEMRFIMRSNKMYAFRWEVGKNVFEMSVNGLYDRRISFDTYVAQLTTDADKDRVMAYLRNPQMYINGPMHDLRALRERYDGDQLKWYDISLLPEYDNDGNYVGVFGVRCDVTDLIETKQRLEEQSERARNSSKLKAHFLASMTHELRTPLNAINGFAEIMPMLDTPEEKKQYVDIMSHSCTQLICLVDNILQISTIDTEGIKFRRQEQDFAKVFLEKAGDMRQYIADPSAVSYRVDTPQKTLIETVDAERILQILDIFVNNAAKFTTHGYVHVGYRADADQLTVYCRDSGCGIPKDQQAKIYDRFFKIDEFAAGTGLGLALAKTIADRMGATIDIYSDEGKGTVMSLTVPLSGLPTEEDLKNTPPETAVEGNTLVRS